MLDRRPSTAVLLIAFGGPTTRCRRGAARSSPTCCAAGPSRPSGIEEVVHHYELIGGRSPLNEMTFRQARALRAPARARGPALPVYVGMRNWHPYLRETLARMRPRRRAPRARRHPRGAAERRELGALPARRRRRRARALGGAAPAGRLRCPAGTTIRCSSRRWPTRARARSSHARPSAASGAAPGLHRAQHPGGDGGRLALRRAARERARRWSPRASGIASYRARLPEPQRQPARSLARARHRRGVCARQPPRRRATCVVVPLGFVCDHVEVLYDLDVEAQQASPTRLGVALRPRAARSTTIPTFIRMLADVVRARSVRPMTRRTRTAAAIAVVGGGISGPRGGAPPGRAQPRARPADRRCGCSRRRRGSAASIATERTGGFVIEAGPDSFLSEKPAALRALRAPRPHRPPGRHARGVPPHVRRPRRPPARAARRLPAAGADAPLAARDHAAVLVAGQAAHGARPACCRAAAATATRASARFVRRRLGREALERVAQPLVGGIYTADPDRLSLAATMPRFLDMERAAAQHHPRRCGASSAGAARGRADGSGARWSLFLSFDGGMQMSGRRSSPQRLPEGVVRLRTSRCARSRARRRRLAHRRRRASATPSSSPCPRTPARTARARRRRRLAAELGAIPYASSATVTLAYPARGRSPSRSTASASSSRAIETPRAPRRHVQQRQVSRPCARPSSRSCARSSAARCSPSCSSSTTPTLRRACARELAELLGDRAAARADAHRPLAARHAAVPRRPSRPRRAHPRSAPRRCPGCTSPATPTAASASPTASAAARKLPSRSWMRWRVQCSAGSPGDGAGRAAVGWHCTLPDRAGV